MKVITQQYIQSFTNQEVNIYLQFQLFIIYINNFLSFFSLEYRVPYFVIKFP